MFHRTTVAKTSVAIIAMAAVIVPAASSSASLRQADTTPAAAKNAALQATCRSAGPIPVTAIPARVDLATCPIQGRKVYLPSVHGRPSPGLYVPGPGHFVTDNILSTKGSYTLSVANSHGQLVIKLSLPGASPSRARPPQAPALDAACGQSNYGFIGGRWQSTLAWYYNESSVSGSGLSVSASLTDIRAGNSNITLGINNCGYAETGFKAYGSFSGNTSKSANIGQNGQCLTRDNQNTVSWGPLNNSDVAEDCIWGTADGVLNEADMYLGTNQHIVDNLPANCTNSRDLQSVATHEWGHEFGLDDLTDAASSALVMYQFQRPCTLRRHLGKGDYNGMGSIYGFR